MVLAHSCRLGDTSLDRAEVRRSKVDEERLDQSLLLVDGWYSSKKVCCSVIRSCFLPSRSLYKTSASSWSAVPPLLLLRLQLVRRSVLMVMVIRVQPLHADSLTCLLGAAGE